MKHLLQIVFISLFITALSAPINKASAQGTHSLAGIIADSSTTKPIDYVTVSLKSGDGKMISSALTKTNGFFSFENIAAAKYTLSVSYVGYKTKDISVTIADSAKHLNLGAILLASQQNSLKEVAVTANKEIIKRKADRIIYDLQADPESRGSNVLDMMRKVPYITVDANDNILLKGNSSFKVFINGKPSPMLANNLSAVLRSMPASTIQSIEVITIPPSKYDAEGLAGIINIITNKKVDNGYNGSLNVNETAPQGGPAGGGSFTVKEGKLAISGYGGINQYNQPQANNSYSRVTTGDGASNLVQNGYGKSNSTNNYYGTQLSYEIDSLNLISADLNGFGSHANGSSFQASQLFSDGTLAQGYDLNNTNNATNGGIDAALNYQLGFKRNKNQLLTFSYQYSGFGSNSHSTVDVGDTVNFPTPDYKQYDHEHSSEQTAQVDYVQPEKDLNIEAGIKAIFRDNKSDYQYSALSPDNAFDLVPDLSDGYNNTQDIYSVYNSYELNLKTWNIHGGLRLEQTITNADFASSATEVKQNYLNLLPAFAASKAFADHSSLNFGFSQRIKRPSINRLNPYIDRSNPDIETTGNPYLRPNIINEIEVGYSMQKKVSVNLGLSYDFMNNLDLQVATFDPVNHVTLFTYQNVGFVSGLQSNININYPVTKRYNMSLNSYMMYLTLSGTVDGVLIKSTHMIVTERYSNEYGFDDGWRLNADLDFSARNPTSLQGSSNGMISTSFGVNKELIKNKLNFSAGIKNPFTKFRNNIAYTYGPGFQEYYTSQQYFRSFNLSLNYSFGKLKDGVKKSKTEINNDDK